MVTNHLAEDDVAAVEVGGVSRELTQSVSRSLIESVIMALLMVTNHLAEDDVAAVEVGGGDHGDEELAAYVHK